MTNLAAGQRSAARPWRAIGWAGLAAGVLDILFAILLYGRLGASPVRVLQGVAAGALGSKAAVAGGLATATLGLTLHFVIAFGVAAVFYAASRRWRGLIVHPWLSGAVFGVLVWLFMNLVVLPLSATPPTRFPPAFWLPVLSAHITCVGWPIAWLVRRVGL